MSDGIIDLTAYLRDREGDADGPPARGAFALWGAEGERSRFALPLWRVVYLAGGGRGGIVSTRAGEAAPTPFVVLDLEQDPPRLDFPMDMTAALATAASPALEDLAGGRGLAVFLGAAGERRWYLLVAGGDERGELRSRDREDILFLSGECAGLLFLRDFADDDGDDE